MDWLKLFKIINLKIDDKLEITVFEVEKLSEDIENCLDQNLITVCEGGGSDSDIDTVKNRVIDLFEGKSLTWQMGAVAEFFIHLYINLTGFRQECMFFNLEERSIKKGFDGYYSNGQQWVMESKSGSIDTNYVSHSSKMREAITDLSNKFSGNVTNNSWLNAYNHACHCDVGSPSDIRKSIKKLSDDYTNKKYHMLEEFNIMPCATIFLGALWNPKDKNTIIKEVTKVINRYTYKQAHLICVTQSGLYVFKSYIGIP